MNPSPSDSSIMISFFSFFCTSFLALKAYLISSSAYLRLEPVPHIDSAHFQVFNYPANIKLAFAWILGYLFACLAAWDKAETYPTSSTPHPSALKSDAICTKRVVQSKRCSQVGSDTHQSNMETMVTCWSPREWCGTSRYASLIWPPCWGTCCSRHIGCRPLSGRTSRTWSFPSYNQQPFSSHRVAACSSTRRRTQWCAWAPDDCA